MDEIKEARKNFIDVLKAAIGQLEMNIDYIIEHAPCELPEETREIISEAYQANTEVIFVRNPIEFNAICKLKFTENFKPSKFYGKVFYVTVEENIAQYFVDEYFDFGMYVTDLGRVVTNQEPIIDFSEFQVVYIETVTHKTICHLTPDQKSVVPTTNEMENVDKFIYIYIPDEELIQRHQRQIDVIEAKREHEQNMNLLALIKHIRQKKADFQRILLQKQPLVSIEMINQAVKHRTDFNTPLHYGTLDDPVELEKIFRNVNVQMYNAIQNPKTLEINIVSIILHENITLLTPYSGSVPGELGPDENGKMVYKVRPKIKAKKPLALFIECSYTRRYYAATDNKLKNCLREEYEELNQYIFYVPNEVHYTQYIQNRLKNVRKKK